MRFLTSLLACLLPWFALAQAPTPTTLTISTGDTEGKYYASGGEICRKATFPETTRCQVQASGGSIDNVQALHAKQVDFAIAQSDVIFSAIKGTSPFSEKFSEIRYVQSLYPELLTLVVRKSAPIQRLRDIVGKRINLGNPGSGQYRTTLDLLAVCQIQKSDLALAGTMKISEMKDAMQANRIDGFFYVVSHPAPNLTTLAQELDVRFIPIAEPCVDRLLSTRAFYIRGEIPAHTYPDLDKNVPTIGLEALLITRRDVSSDWVKAIAKTSDTNSRAPNFLTPYNGK